MKTCYTKPLCIANACIIIFLKAFLQEKYLLEKHKALSMHRSKNSETAFNANLDPGPRVCVGGYLLLGPFRGIKPSRGGVGKAAL